MTERASAPILHGEVARFATFVRKTNGLFSMIPHGLIAAVGRFSIAAVFWKSGQTKVQGFAVDIVEGTFSVGLPRLADSAVDLFREEYRLPIIPPELAAPLAAVAEHILPVLLLIGLATRFAASGLFVMTLVIQIFVYPGAYPVHGVWMAVLLYLMARGPGAFSLDHLLARHFRQGR